MGPLCDHFDLYLEGATALGPIDGLDIALTYLRGHGRDVMGYESSVSLILFGIAEQITCGMYVVTPVV